MKKFDQHVLPCEDMMASTRLLEQRTVMIRTKLMSSFGTATTE